MLSNREVILSENHPEVLKGLALFILENNEKLAKENAKLRKLEAESKLRELELDYQRTILRDLVFGHGVEKSRASSGRNRRIKPNEQLLLHAQSLAPAPTEEERKNLERSVVSHEMTGAELVTVAKEMGLDRQEQSAFSEIKGLTDDAVEITVIERRYISELHKLKKYRYHPAPDENLEKEVIVTAERTDKLFSGAGYSIDFALSVVRDKYEYHKPLERQTREMQRLGLNVGTKTLYNMAEAVSVHMEPTVSLVLQDIFKAGLAVECDETPWFIQSNHDDDGQMWTASNQAGTYYRFEPTRSGKVIAEILKDYAGPVMADGYGGYNRLTKDKKIDLAGCWAHARRKFIELEDVYPEDVGWVLDRIGELSSIEYEAKNYEELQKLRHEKSRPLAEKIRGYLVEMKTRHLPESALIKKAVNYTLKRWDCLTKFLDDARIPLTNNGAERAMRHAVMGRKNFNGSQTINGADTASVLYTIIESCKKVEVDPTTFMKEIILRNNRDEPSISPLQYAKQIRTPPAENQ
ncbi:MAG: transposase IS66 [uncultured bacterium]|nr:MAG: transposase IS66 [uncultured bacterium]HLD44266.1 IS66 family transposase [bacterium]